MCGGDDGWMLPLLEPSGRRAGFCREVEGDEVWLLLGFLLRGGWVTRWRRGAGVAMEGGDGWCGGAGHGRGGG